MTHLQNTLKLNQYGNWQGMRCYLRDTNTNTVLLPIWYCEQHNIYTAKLIGITTYFIR